MKLTYPILSLVLWLVCAFLYWFFSPRFRLSLAVLPLPLLSLAAQVDAGLACLKAYAAPVGVQWVDTSLLFSQDVLHDFAYLSRCYGIFQGVTLALLALFVLCLFLDHLVPGHKAK